MPKDIPILRCIHRHTIDDHPNCFARGLVKWPNEEITDRKWEKLTGAPWYTFPEYRIGYLDIETDSLKANFGTILTWAVKEKDGPIVTDSITKEDLFNGRKDFRITESLLAELRRFKIIVTYYGTGFDVPFTRSKALHYGLDFPLYGEMYHFDLYYRVRSSLKLHRNSLDAATSYLGIEGKTPITHRDWYEAKYGNEVALRKVLEHNIADVIILEKLHDKLEPFSKWTRRSV